MGCGSVQVSRSPDCSLLLLWGSIGSWCSRLRHGGPSPSSRPGSPWQRIPVLLAQPLCWGHGFSRCSWPSFYQCCQPSTLRPLCGRWGLVWHPVGTGVKRLCRAGLRANSGDESLLLSHFKPFPLGGIFFYLLQCKTRSSASAARAELCQHPSQSLQNPAGAGEGAGELGRTPTQPH